MQQLQQESPTQSQESQQESESPTQSQTQEARQALRQQLQSAQSDVQRVVAQMSQHQREQQACVAALHRTALRIVRQARPDATLQPSVQLLQQAEEVLREPRARLRCHECRRWWHGACLGLDDAAARLVELFVCDECTLRRRTPWRTLLREFRSRRVPLPRALRRSVLHWPLPGVGPGGQEEQAAELPAEALQESLRIVLRRRRRRATPTRTRTERDRDTRTERDRDRQTDRQTDTYTDRHTDRQTGIDKATGGMDVDPGLMTRVLPLVEGAYSHDYRLPDTRSSCLFDGYLGGGEIVMARCLGPLSGTLLQRVPPQLVAEGVVSDEIGDADEHWRQRGRLVPYDGEGDTAFNRCGSGRVPAEFFREREVATVDTRFHNLEVLFVGGAVLPTEQWYCAHSDDDDDESLLSLVAPHLRETAAQLLQQQRQAAADRMQDDDEEEPSPQPRRRRKRARRAVATTAASTRQRRSTRNKAV
ncbi:MAG: hypothetical protein MHM6MM_006936 [Cercozoa sp. M6MM]